MLMCLKTTYFPSLCWRYSINIMYNVSLSLSLCVYGITLLPLKKPEFYLILFQNIKLERTLIHSFYEASITQYQRQTRTL